MPEIETRAHVGAEGGVVKYHVLVQYIPTHVPHDVFHVVLYILLLATLHLAQALVKTVAPPLHFVLHSYH